MTQEEIKYHNRLWYYKTYNQLIDKCIQMEKDGYPEDMYTEVHHILPKCQGGTDEKCNLVRMPVRYHVVAHMLLASAFPDDKKIIYSINAMFIYSKHNELRYNTLNKISSRLISYFRENMAKMQKGTKLSKLQKEKISNSMKKFRRNGNSILSVVCHDSDYNIYRIYECINDAISDGFYPKGIRDSIYSQITYRGYKFSLLSFIEESFSNKIIEFNNLSELPKLNIVPYKRNGKDNYNCKRVIGPDGTIYDSISDCGRKVGHNSGVISVWIRKHPEKGFRFYTENNDDN